MVKEWCRLWYGFYYTTAAAQHGIFPICLSKGNKRPYSAALEMVFFDMLFVKLSFLCFPCFQKSAMLGCMLLISIFQNAELQLNLGDTPFEYPPLGGFKAFCNAPQDCMSISSVTSQSGEKQYWVVHWAYNVLGCTK